MEDFKELIYFAASLIISAFLITAYITLFGSVTDRASEARNIELTARQGITNTAKYENWNGKTVNGLQVISALRENSLDGELSIYVNQTKSGALTMNASNYKSDTFRLSKLTGRISAAANYKAVLVYDNISAVSGINFTMQ